MDLPVLEEERQWAIRNTRNALIGLDIEDFDNMSPEERLEFYGRYMLSSGLLLITTDDGSCGEAIGLWGSTTVFLCRKHMTQRDWLTREARSFYLSNNYFRIHEELVPSFLENCNNPFRDPEGGMDPKQCIRKFNILLRSGEAGSDSLQQILSLLGQCGEQLQVVILEVQGQSHEDFARLTTCQSELERLDRKFQDGILVVANDSGSTTSAGPRILELPWEKAEGKQQKALEALQEWQSRFRNSEQVDYDTESDDEQIRNPVESS